MYQLQSRFLVPFFMRHQVCDAAAAALTKLQFSTRKDTLTVWQTADPPDVYHSEFLTACQQFLFADCAQDAQYFQVNPTLAAQWLNHVQLHYEKKPLMPIQLVDANRALELFLLPNGVGLLSITLAFAPSADMEVNPSLLQEFNYRLSQTLAKKVAQLAQPHSGHEKSPPAPALDASLTERLGKPGGVFTLPELRDFLLSPLQNFEYHCPQQQFSVFSVLRIAQNLDFTDPAAQAAWQPLLRALAHVEEPAHAGSLQLTHEQLNTRHWAAVGSLGAVHLLADQDEEVAFNQQRVKLVLGKYFIPYWMALAQRLILLHTLERGLAVIRDPNADEATENAYFQTLHSDLLRFMLTGYFAEISEREAHNQYYQLARQGLRVESAFEHLRRALHDADMKSDMQFQKQTMQAMSKTTAELKELTAQTAKTTDETHHMHQKLEWLEIFFASYYGGALAHYLAIGLFTHLYASISTALWAIAAGFIAYLVLKHEKEKHDKKRFFYRLLKVLFGVIVVLSLWFGAGYKWFPEHDDSHAPTPTANEH